MMARLNPFNGLLYMLRSLLEALREFGDLWGLLRRIWTALRRWICGKRPFRRSDCWIELPPSEYKRPDPLIYSQFYLMAQGLSVTWDNPDIQLYDSSGPVDSHDLEADKDYEVVVRIWNNSYDAPVANLPVYLTYLDFGVGTTPQWIGKAYVDLGVKGSAFAPAYAKFTWHTPVTPGHYCMQARLDWPDDANPDNNLGQENTNVGITQSPAAFDFKVKNDAGIVRRFRLEPDLYRLPARKPCPSEEIMTHKTFQVQSRLEESQQLWEQALAEQGHGMFPVGTDWDVQIDPQSFTLQPGAEQGVHVEIEYKPGGFIGEMPFNIQCFAAGANQDWSLVGGVTLTVKGE